VKPPVLCEHDLQRRRLVSVAWLVLEAAAARIENRRPRKKAFAAKRICSGAWNLGIFTLAPELRRSIGTFAVNARIAVEDVATSPSPMKDVPALSHVHLAGENRQIRRSLMQL